MKSLSLIQQDLLQLVKGNYVCFNDKNARELIAVVLEPHYLISRKLCRDYAFQNRMMFETMRYMYPEYWREERNMFAMIDAFSKSPEEGHRFLYGVLSYTVVREPRDGDEPGELLFDVGVIDLKMREKLTAVLAEIAELAKAEAA